MSLRNGGRAADVVGVAVGGATRLTVPAGALLARCCEVHARAALAIMPKTATHATIYKQVAVAVV